MNLRKFISGVSALTIAASAFAGMAVTASAALQEVDFIGTSTDAQNFTGYSTTGWTGTGGCVISAAAVSEEDVLSLSAPTKNTTGTATYGINAVDNGTIYFKAKLSFGGTKDGAAIRLKSSAGNDVFVISLKAGGGNTYNTITGTSVKNGASSTKFNTRKVDYLTIDATIELGGTATVIYTNNSGDTETLTTSVSGDYDVSSLVIDTYNSNRNSANYTYIDNLQFYAMTNAAAATAVDISYKLNNEEVASDSYSVVSQGASVGDTVTYTIPKYIRNESTGKLYMTSSPYSTTVTTTAASTPVDVDVTYVTDAYAKFVEVNGGNSGSGYSGGSYKGTGIGANQDRSISFTVEETGIYSLEAIGNTSNTTAYLGIVTTTSKNNTLGNMTSNVVVKTSTFEQGMDKATTASDFVLNAGTTYYVVASSGSTGCDYVLLTKTSKDITVAETTNGTVTSDVAYANPGDIVTLTVTPDTNYALEAITGVEATKVNDTTYTFTMPATDVTVSATFTASAPVVTTQDDQGFTFETTLNAVKDLNVYVTKTESGETKTSNGVAIQSLIGDTQLSGEGGLKLAIILENIPEAWSNISVKVAE